MGSNFRRRSFAARCRMQRTSAWREVGDPFRGVGKIHISFVIPRRAQPDEGSPRKRQRAKGSLTGKRARLSTRALAVRDDAVGGRKFLFLALPAKIPQKYCVFLWEPYMGGCRAQRAISILALPVQGRVPSEARREGCNGRNRAGMTTLPSALFNRLPRSRRRKERRRQRSRFLTAMTKTSVRRARTPHRGDAHNVRLTPQGEAFGSRARALSRGMT